MKKIFERLFVFGVGVGFLISCSAENVNEEVDVLNATSTSNVTVQDLQVSDLVGTWNMYSMTSIPVGDEDGAVDFDQNGNYTNDLLLETDCFDDMYFVFDSTGNVDTRQSRLFFQSSGEFTCDTTGDYSAAYGIDGNTLSVTFSVDGMTFTETKTISRYSENGNEFLMVTLTKAETSTAVYVEDDPGNTVASGIQQIDMVYLKQ